MPNLCGVYVLNLGFPKDPYQLPSCEILRCCYAMLESGLRGGCAPFWMTGCQLYRFDRDMSDEEIQKLWEERKVDSANRGTEVWPN